MAAIVLKVCYAVKQRLLKNLRRCRDAGTRQRYLIIVNLLSGRSARTTATVLHVHSTTVYRVVRRFQSYGEAGLADGRADNGADKIHRTHSWQCLQKSSVVKPPSSAMLRLPMRNNCVVSNVGLMRTSDCWVHCSNCRTTTL